MTSEVPDHYWKNLLALTTKVSADSETEPTDVVRHMNDENREWLESVMVDLVRETDPSKQLDSVMDSLHCYAAGTSHLNEEDVDKVEDLGFRLQDLLLFADLTPKFVSKGGLLMIEKFLSSFEFEKLQMVFAEAILTMSENNPPAQQALVEAGFLSKLLEYLKNDKLSPKFRLKLLGAVSGAVRSNEEAFDAFLSLSGPAVLSSLFHSDNSSLAAKSVRVLTSMAYTMQDSATRAKVLFESICSGYTVLSERSTPGDHEGEFEYIREFLQQYVAPEDISEDVRKGLVSSLTKQLLENGNEAGVSVTRALLKKFASLRSG